MVATPPYRRVLAGLASLVAMAAAIVVVFLTVWGSVWVGQKPDPSVPDGDPCCGHPDTWGQVADGAAWMLALALLAGLLLAASVGLTTVAARGRWPRRRWLAIAPATTGVACLVAEAALVIPNL